MATEHRVAGHLGVAAEDYDRAITALIPSYDRMLATIVRWLTGHLPAGGLVVDLGAGTGALSAAILDAFPDVRVQLVDVDPSMLEVAAARCAAHSGRAELRRGLFADSIPPCHAVVASLALHHLRSDDDRQDLYRRVFGSLEPGGIVAVGDLFVYEEGLERDGMFQAWYEHMSRHGIDRVEADGHFGQWAQEDRYVSLRDELELMASVGFRRPECFWRDGGIAVVGAFKDAA